MKLFAGYQVDYTKRNYGLDIIRSIAILFVLIDHLAWNPFPFSLGGIGVEIFFVLSGFLIGQILIKDAAQGLDVKGIFHFWIRRWFRTIPLYYLVLLIKFLHDSSIGSNIVYYLFFLQNNFFGISFFSVSWSLVIEEWFYISLPIAVSIGLLILKEVRRIWMILIAFAAFIIAFKWFWIAQHHTPWSGINGNPLFRMDSMLVGVILAYIKLHKKSWFTWLQSVWVGILSFFLAIGATYALGQYFLAGSVDTAFYPRYIWFTVFSMCVAGTIPFIATRFNGNSQQVSWFRKWITLTSILSYGMYLVHHDLWLEVGKLQLISNKELLCCFDLGVLYLVSYILHVYYEKPMTQLREKWS